MLLRAARAAQGHVHSWGPGPLALGAKRGRAVESAMARGVLLDIDGVLTTSWMPLPGAVQTIDWLRAQGIDFRLMTNSSAMSRVAIATRLSSLGMSVDATDILTAVTSAASYLAEHHGGQRCFVLNEGDFGTDLEGVDVVGPEAAEFVLLGGAGPSLGFSELDQVFKLLGAGVPVIALHRNTHFQTRDGPTLDMGALIVGLEAAAAIDIPIVGKPAPTFFESALSALDVVASDAIMVGDDIGSDVIGAQAVGISGVLVRTGKFREEDLERSAAQPDHIITTIGELPDLWRLLDA